MSAKTLCLCWFAFLLNLINIIIRGTVSFAWHSLDSSPNWESVSTLFPMCRKHTNVFFFFSLKNNDSRATKQI